MNEAVHIDRLLGPASRRFFGSGYRRVHHTVAPVPVSHKIEHEQSWVGQACYPGDWSVRGDTETDPHLSSIDAIALCLQVLERNAPGQWGEREYNLRVAQINLRGGSDPWQNLNHIPIDFRIEPGPEPHSSRVQARVGNLRISMRVEEVAAGSANRALLDLEYRDNEHHAFINSARPGQESIAAQHQVASPSSVTTCVDYFATLGQVAQLLAFSSSGLSREDGQNLWMRRCSLNLTHQAATHSAAFSSRTSIASSRVLGMGGSEILDIKVVTDTDTGVRAISQLSCALPQKTGKPSVSSATGN